MRFTTMTETIQCCPVLDVNKGSEGGKMGVILVIVVEVRRWSLQLEGGTATPY